MKNSYQLTSLGALILMAAANGRANQLYVGADGGGAFQQNVSIRGGTGFGGAGGDVKFQTGSRAGAFVGYGFCKYFSAELDVSDIYNRITQAGQTPFSASSPGGSAHLNEIPILIKGEFTWPLGAFKPYIGVGVGAMIGMFDSSNITGTTGNYSDTDFTFAYQGEAGLRYSFTRHIDLGVAYEFVGTTDHEWRDSGIPLKTDGTMTQSILGTFSYRF
jgi:opacity protein-like surface antigen